MRARPRCVGATYGGDRCLSILSPPITPRRLTAPAKRRLVQPDREQLPPVRDPEVLARPLPSPIDRDVVVKRARLWDATIPHDAESIGDEPAVLLLIGHHTEGTEASQSER